MWQSPQFPVDLVTFTDEILNGKLHFLCGVSWISQTYFSECPTENNLLMPWRRFDFTLQRERFIINLLNFSTIDNVKSESFEIGLCFTRNLTFWFLQSSIYCTVKFPNSLVFYCFLRHAFFNCIWIQNKRELKETKTLNFS